MEEQTKKENKNEAIKITCGILIIVLLIFGLRTFVFKPVETGVSENTVAVKETLNPNDVQTINLGMKNGNYYPNRIEVQAGKPVKIIADMGQINGCARGIAINSLGIKKQTRPGDNVIEFTPTQKGVIPFNCMMGMYTGQIVVN